MSTAKVELDFFAMENHDNNNASASNSHSLNFFRRQRSLKEIQSAISKIKPEILKSVIASGSLEHQISPKRASLSPSSPEGDDHMLQSLPVYSPYCRMSSENSSDTAPLTIFYNETVAVFHVTRDEAEIILKLAEKGNATGKGADVEKEIPAAVNFPDEQKVVDVDAQDEDLPIARKRSLQRFLEKRKDRLIPSWPL